jgi:hypothetical protein
MCDRARRASSPLDHVGPASMDAVGELHKIAKHAIDCRIVERNGAARVNYRKNLFECLCG